MESVDGFANEMGFVRNTVLGALLCSALAAVAAADDPEEPDMELLEFLGIWDQEDDDWGEFVDLVTDMPDTETTRSASRDDENDYEWD
jgi:hypothetical protein